MKCDKCQASLNLYVKDAIQEKNRTQDIAETQIICPSCGAVKVIKFGRDK
jgi:RNase P subunit RPR2